MTNKIRHYLTYLLPWVFILIGIWAFFQITSFRYAKAINFIDWLLSGSDNIELALRDVDTVMGIMKRAIFTRDLSRCIIALMTKQLLPRLKLSMQRSTVHQFT